MKAAPRPRFPHPASRGAFTIVEVLVASTVLILILGMALSIIGQTSNVTRQATTKITAFQGARTSFDLITKLLSQATLNSYWDYDNPNAPTRYLRKSELHFLIGNAGEGIFPGTAGTGQAIFFQSPVGRTANQATYGGLVTLLNACGFYIEYGDEAGLPSPFPSAPAKYRYRLMQAIQPTENMEAYTDKSQDGSAWVDGIAANSAPVADNIILLLAWARKSPEEDPNGNVLTSNYAYNSRLNATSSPQPETANQLPPTVHITMVAIDETSAERICKAASPPSEISSLASGLFTTSDDSSYKQDMETLTTRLSASKLNYRVFSSAITLRESKMQ